MICKYGDPFCPCPDGDMCHYEGPNPMPAPARKVKTDFWAKPIPLRQFDWCAYFDGEEEDGDYGYGRTEQDAVMDLLTNAAIATARPAEQGA